MKPEKPLKGKISYYLSHPIQYFSPLLKEMAKTFDLHVYYFSDVSIRGGLDRGFGQKVKWDIPLLEGYTYSFIKNYSKREALDNHFWDVINPGVINVLFRDSSSIVIVNGWSYSSTLLVIIFGRIFGKQVWIRSENSLSKEILKPRWLLLIKKLVLKHFLFRFWVNRFLYIGTDSRDFFRFYGVSDKKLLYTPYAVDNDFFSYQYKNLLPKKESLKQELGLPVDKTIVLFTGKYMPVKRPLDLLKAFAYLNDPAIALVMVGDGELRYEMEQYIRDSNLNNVFLTGFVNQSRIAEYYSVGDLIVLCSESETWGLSVNEAMNFALPVIVSDSVGCAHDLVIEGENGCIFPKGDVEALAEKINLFVKDPVFRQKAGIRSQVHIGQYNYKITVDNLEAAAEALA